MDIRCWFRELLDLFIPPTCCLCGCIVMRSDRIKRLCATCENDAPRFPSSLCLIPEGPLDKLWALGPYGGLLKEAVVRLKFQKRREVVKLIGAFWSEHFQIDERYDCIIPVPLHPTRARSRGYNQASLLAREIGARMQVPVGHRHLCRVRSTRPQSELEVRDRQENMRGSITIAADSGTHIKGRSFLLVDDVYTTGATLTECARVLKKAGAIHVGGFVLAKTL